MRLLPILHLSSAILSGRACLQSGDRKRAEKEWTDAANRGGRFAQLYLALSQLKLDAGDPDAAARYAQQALNLNPAAMEARLVLGSAYGNKTSL